MRSQSWERAKGELEAIRATDFGPTTGGAEAWRAWEKRCARRLEVMTSFINAMEHEGLY